VEAHRSTVHLVAVHDLRGPGRATQRLPARHHLDRPTFAEKTEVEGLLSGTDTGDTLDEPGKSVPPLRVPPKRHVGTTLNLIHRAPHVRRHAPTYAPNGHQIPPR
jgi:hypothetical protein